MSDHPRLGDVGEHPGERGALIGQPAPELCAKLVIAAIDNRPDLGGV